MPQIILKDKNLSDVEIDGNNVEESQRGKVELVVDSCYIAHSLFKNFKSVKIVNCSGGYMFPKDDNGNMMVCRGFFVENCGDVTFSGESSDMSVDDLARHDGNIMNEQIVCSVC